MTYRNYRNSLNKQMMSYLRFMKCADTDQQLLDLNTEVNELRVKVHNLDQLTASQMMETVEFTESTYESFGFPDFHIDNSVKRHFEQKTSLSLMRKQAVSKISKYLGVHYVPNMEKWRAKLSYQKIIYLDSYFITEEEAVRGRDKTIIKYNLPLPLQVLKKI